VLHQSRLAHLLLIIVTTLLPVAYGPAKAAEPAHKAGESPTKVQGKIVDIQPDFIVVKTSLTSYRLNKKTAPLNAALGDTVTLWVTSGHAVIDHHRQDTGQRHRFLTGTLLDSASKQQIKLWTPEGDKVYPLDSHQDKINHLAEGTMVTVEINEAGTVINANPVETEVAACDKRHHCKVMLHGMVRKIQDGMIFIKTPVVEYEVPTSIAPRDTAVGDEMTLWVNENSVVLNYHRTGESSHRRFVTGTLRYTNKAHARIQLWTPEGEQTFSLVEMERAGHLQEGRPVTVEISEAGAVLDLWQTS